MFLFFVISNPSRKVVTASHEVTTLITTDLFGKSTHSYIGKDFEIRVLENGLNRFGKAAIQLFCQALISGNSQNWHGNSIRISRAEMLCLMGIDATPDTIDYFRRSSMKALTELQSLSVSISTATKRGEASLKACASIPLFTQASMKPGSGEIILSLHPNIIFSLSRYHHIFPIKALKISNRYGMLLVQMVYFRLAMSRTPGIVNIRNMDILAALGLPIDKKYVAGRKYGRTMLEPVREAIHAINKSIADDLVIEFDDQADVNSFLSGFTTFRVINPEAIQYYQRRHAAALAKKELRAQRAQQFKHAQKARQVLQQYPQKGGLGKL